MIHPKRRSIHFGLLISCLAVQLIPVLLPIGDFSHAAVDECIKTMAPAYLGVIGWTLVSAWRAGDRIVVFATLSVLVYSLLNLCSTTYWID